MLKYLKDRFLVKWSASSSTTIICVGTPLKSRNCIVQKLLEKNEIVKQTKISHRVM